MTDEDAAPAFPIIDEPREPVPPVVETVDALLTCVAAIGGGEGPVAVDVERASGHRYSQRAYLIQVHRRGGGTWLIDPIAVPDLGALGEVLTEPEWVLHAANQDLPSLAELELSPARLFDTELAGRLLGCERVGLSAMTERFLGVGLAKAHSAADWSRRPLPESWLSYAALDVDLLVDLRDILATELLATGRDRWAEQEFEAVRTAPPPAPRTDPWRRVKGLRTRRPRTLAIVREVWLARDDLARELDRGPSRILPDSTIVAMAENPPLSIDALGGLPGMRGQSPSRRARWLAAVKRGLELPTQELPEVRVPNEGTPNPRSWARLNPVADRRLEAAKAALTEVAEELEVPRENLMPPRILRDAVWTLSGADRPASALAPDAEQVAGALAAAGARPWQVEVAGPTVATAIDNAEIPDVDPEPDQTALFD